jgi:hypothetical protein
VQRRDLDPAARSGRVHHELIADEHADMAR